MEAGRFVVGVAVLAATLGGSAWVATVVLRRRLDGLRGAVRVVGWAVVFTAALVAVHLLPAAVGLLSPLAVVVTALALSAVATAVPARSAAPEAPHAGEHDDAAESRWSWLLVAVSGSLLAGWLLAHARANATADLRHPDIETFHLPVVARWLQRDSIWGNDQFVPFFANGNYPQNGNVLQLAAILPFDQDAFVKFVFHPFLALTVVAVYALGRELGAQRPVAWLAGMAFAGAPIVAYGTTVAVTDTLLYFAFAAGALFLLRHRRTRAAADLVVAGVALGLAFGTKWYGVSGVAAFVVVWLVHRAVTERRVGAPLRDTVLVGGLVALAGGIWLVRNLAFTPSPLFPSSVPPLFDAPPDVYTERFGFTIADYLLDGGVWVDRLLPGWWDSVGATAPVALLGLAAAAVLLATRRWRPATVSSLVLCCATATVLLVLYALTPHGAYGPEGDPLLVGPNSRYGLTAIVLACALTAAVAGRLGRLRIVVEVALAASVLVGLATYAELVSESLWAALTAVVLIAVLLVVRGRDRLAALRAPAWRLRLAAAGAAMIVAGAVGALEVQQRHAAGRYASGDAVLEWITRNAAGGHRIGIAGNLAEVDPSREPPRPIYGAFGPRLDNHVAYVGPFVDGMLRRYHEPRAFTRALARGRHDLLIVYRHGSPPRPAPEERWALSAGFEVVVSSGSLALLHGSPAGVSERAARSRRSAPGAS